jgi:zinc protease
MPAVTVSDKTFVREVLSAAIPVIVEFSAPQTPHTALDELASSFAGSVNIVKVDVNRYPTLRDEYGVRGLPTFVLFKHGKQLARRLGGRLSKHELQEWIDGALILALATRKTSIARRASDFRLASGMHVVVVPDHRAPVVTHMVCYKAGTADEPTGLSGVAHLVEHLTFKSLDKFAGGDFTRTLRRAGGVADAAIARDFTTYWLRVPREQLRFAMMSEADRMANFRVTDDEVARVREVVLEQRRAWIENEPGARLVEKMHAALYRAHPYGLPVIGLANETARLSRHEAERFHKLHYAPDNAVIVVVGDVTPEQVRELARETFGAIPNNPDNDKRARHREPLHISARRVTLDDPRCETTVFRRSYAVPGCGTASPDEIEALHVLVRILAGGTASVLYRRLVIDDKAATAVACSYSSNVLGSGQLEISAKVVGTNFGAVEGAIDAVLEDIRRSGVDSSDLGRAKTWLAANHIYHADDQISLAHRYAWAVSLGQTIAEADDRLAAIARVSSSDIKRVAKTYLVPRRSVTGCLSRQRDGKAAAHNGRTTAHRSF